MANPQGNVDDFGVVELASSVVRFQNELTGLFIDEITNGLAEERSVPSKMKLSMEKRMEALRGGQMTDCTFLVGPDPDGAQEIHACKFDLLLASEYFAGLFRSHYTEPGPIRIKHIEPDVFQLVVEFIHTSGHMVSKVNELEQCLKLVSVADEFMIEELSNFCSRVLNNLITVENVWKAFNDYHFIRVANRACQRLLCSKTEKCLKQPAFMEINLGALTRFLKIKKLGIQSDMVLVTACLKYFEDKENKRVLFRQAALPYLRLRTLNTEELKVLAPYLDQEEKVFLSLNLLEQDPLQLKRDYSATKLNLCNEISSRIGFELVDIVPKESILELAKVIEEGHFVRLHEPTLFFLSLTSKSERRFLITGLDILCPLAYDEQGPILDQPAHWDEKAAVKFIINCKNSEVGRGYLKPKRVVGPWAHFNTHILVPSQCEVLVSVAMDKHWFVRKAATLLDVIKEDPKIKIRAYSKLQPVARESQNPMPNFGDGGPQWGHGSNNPMFPGNPVPPFQPPVQVYMGPLPQPYLRKQPPAAAAAPNRRKSNLQVFKRVQYQIL